MVGDKNDSLLWSTDKANKNDQLHAWSPYGSGATNDRLPGFNGGRIDPVSGTYSLSPFDEGGINPYAYCACDPINHTDLSGKNDFLLPY